MQPIAFADHNLPTEWAANWLCLRSEIFVVALQVEEMPKWIAFRFAEFLAWKDVDQVAHSMASQTRAS